MAIKNCLSNHTTDEAKEIQMVWIYVWLLIRIISASIVTEIEQSIVWLEHRLWELNEEISSQTTSIYSFFSAISDTQLASKLSASLTIELTESILEDVITLNRKR